MTFTLEPGMLVDEGWLSSALGVARHKSQWSNEWLIDWDHWGGSTLWNPERLNCLTHCLTGQPLYRQPLFDVEVIERDEYESRCVL